MISVDQFIRKEENSLGFYVANSEENLISGVSTAETINTRVTTTSVELKKSGEKNKCTDNSSGTRRRMLIRKTTWQWLSRGDLKLEQKHCCVPHRSKQSGQTI